jgi:hypothetical protein
MFIRTCTILSAALILGTASAALAMSPTGNSYKPFANAHASMVTEQPLVNVPTTAELADRQSWFYRR